MRLPSLYSQTVRLAALLTCRRRHLIGKQALPNVVPAAVSVLEVKRGNKTIGWRVVTEDEATMHAAEDHRKWISWISVLAYLGLCGLVYLLH